jgi:hypothetical protein
VVAVEHQRAHPCEEGLVTVEVAPAPLHHADLRILKVRDQAPQKIGVGQEVGVEHREQLALGGRQTGVERAGLVANAVGAVQVDHVQSARPQPHDHLLQ